MAAVSAPVRRLLLLRHGKAEDLSGSDFDRALTARGRRDAAEMGARLRAMGVVPDLIVSSSAARAKATALLAALELDIPAEQVRFDVRIYEAEAPTLLALVDEVLTKGTLMLVGHNPGFEDLVGLLCGTGSARLHTAGLAIIELPTRGPLEGQGKLAALERPTSA